MTVKQAAALMNVSVSSVYKSARLANHARAKGCYDEYYSRVMAGEKQSKVFRELMPEVLEGKAHKQAISQFKSTVKKLICTYDHSVDELRDYLDYAEEIYIHDPAGGES